MIILDTDVLCELTRPQPSEAVLAWADSVHGPNVATTAMTVAEVLCGIARLPDGRRKTALSDAIQQLINVDLDGRVYPFNLAATADYATIVSDRDAVGRPIPVSDAQIAAICRNLHAVLATRDTGDFEDTGIKLINPWDMS